MLDTRLANQSLGRPLTAREQRLATALEEVFATGAHDFADVAAALQAKAVERPSGATGAWSEVVLASELSAINAALDEAYARAGIGA